MKDRMFHLEKCKCFLEGIKIKKEKKSVNVLSQSIKQRQEGKE
jgi:hypothetical protein